VLHWHRHLQSVICYAGITTTSKGAQSRRVEFV
jgi:hypothetical protein